MSQPLYELKNIHKSFKLGNLDVPALRGLTLQIAHGEIVALRGPSGSGKSTLLNVLGLLETPTSGEFRFLGEDLTHLNDVKLTEIRRNAIGFIFQNYNLVPILTALENVEYPLRLIAGATKDGIRKQAEKILKAVGLEKFADHKPAQMSGGQQQRVSIARALVKKPKVILADEPTANLDSTNAEQILKLMHQLKEEMGATIIVATHDDMTASYCDRKVSLKDGVLSR
jgi:putative ABC transport system ATP-binding protein